MNSESKLFIHAIHSFVRSKSTITMALEITKAMEEVFEKINQEESLNFTDAG